MDDKDTQTGEDNPASANRQSMDAAERLAKENYAEHLARVTPDADHNRDLLQARYKALHGSGDDSTDNR